MHALILADGDAPPRAALDAAWPGWDSGVELVIAADGGARHAAGLGVTIDRWVGDADSLDSAAMSELAARGIPMERVRPDKDESDTELAVFAALTRGATRLTLVGALGGQRRDHELANVALLALDELAGMDVTIVDATTRIRMIRAPSVDASSAAVELVGRVGDLVSLLPWGGPVAGVTTEGLRYALDDEPLVVGRARGLSNVRTARIATVTLQAGWLVIVETPASL
jgi:thiamine pyrophosphokinase